MLILLCILCIVCVVLYTRQRREGFFKKLKKGFKKHVTAPAASSFRSIKRAIGYKSPAQLAKELRDRLAKEACEVSTGLYHDYNGQRSTEQDKINTLTIKSLDPNFNVSTYNYLNDELARLKTALDENTELNQDLNATLTSTKGYQNASVSMMNTLQHMNQQLTECKANHTLSLHDYDVLN